MKMWDEIKKSLEEQMLLLSKRLDERKDPQDVLQLVQALSILAAITYS